MGVLYLYIKEVKHHHSLSPHPIVSAIRLVTPYRYHSVRRKGTIQRNRKNNRTDPTYDKVNTSCRMNYNINKRKSKKAILKK